jgi:AcrR family transcriptional regulator
MDRESYHHGDLRAAALAAAEALLSEHGHEDLSLRQVADAVGVVHRSLYNHFASREALLDAVAGAGFERLAAKLKAARTMEDYVRIYARFALKSPKLYLLMKSRPHATMKEKPELQRAVHLSIAEAMRIFGKPAANPDDNRRAVMKVLILLHGGLELHRQGILDVKGDEGLIAELQKMVAAG